MTEEKKELTKTCKHCKTEIPKGAKVCPNCRKKQGSKLPVIIIILVIIVGVAISQANNGPKKVDSDGNTNSGSNTSQDLFKVGETVELKNVRATLVSVTESQGTEYLKPDDGNVYLMCEFNIENNSNEDIIVSSMISFDAYCDDYSVNQSLGAVATAGKQLDGTVAAGKKMNGVIGYEVSKDWNKIEINFTPDYWGKAIKFIATK